MDQGTKQFRSAGWFGRTDKDGFLHRSWMRNQGLPGDVFDGRPVIGICNTWSELTPCNTHFRTIADHVRAGVLEAGGFPLEFPVMSLGETLLRPTAMLYRNLASMDVEESIRGNPLDGVVLLVGCDKTTPSLLMGAASVDLPAIAPGDSLFRILKVYSTNSTIKGTVFLNGAPVHGFQVQVSAESPDTSGCAPITRWASRFRARRISRWNCGARKTCNSIC